LEWILWALDAIAQLEQPTDVAALEPGLFKGSVRRVHEATPAQLVVQRNRNGSRAVCGPLLHHHVTAPLPYSLKPVLLEDSACLLTGERPKLTQPGPLPG
jgi:hypothetical protein